MSKSKAKFSIMGISPEPACEKGFEFELKHPFTNEVVGMFVTVLGTESAKVKAHARSKINAQLRAEAKGKAPAPTIEGLESEAIDRAVAATVSWRGMVFNEADGGLEFTEDNARLVYAQAFVRKQVLEASEEMGNFTPN